MGRTRRRVLLGAGALVAATRLGRRGRTDDGLLADQETPTGGATPTGEETPTAEETSTGEETPTETPREDRTETVEVGERADAGPFALVVRTVDRRTLLDGGGSVPRTSILTVELAVKNDSSEPLDVSEVPTPRVRDDSGDSFGLAPGVSDAVFPAGQLVAGEVGRGEVVYTIPATSTGLRLAVDLRPFGSLASDRVVVDLEEEADRLVELTQALDVPVRRIGETVSAGNVEVTMAQRLVTQQVGGDQAGRGSEFVVPTVSVRNGTPEPLAPPVEDGTAVKDDDGLAFAVDRQAYAGLDDALAAAPPVEAGVERTGRLPYEVPDDGRGLFWSFDFSLLGAGDKAFWRLR